MSMDLSIIGIVFAIILFIIFFAAVVLYLSFRIKETFREEKKRGILVVKVAFLIGILFLAGGSFYFFAKILTPSAPITVPDSENTTDIITPSEPDNSTNDTIPSEPETPIDNTPPPTSNETTNQTGTPELNLIISYPSRIRMNTEITLTFSIINPTQYIAHDVVIQTSILFDYFNVISSTHTVTGHAIELEDIPSGTTICSLTLMSSNRPGEVRETIILIFNEMTEKITEEVSISITGGP
jgi:hypothetical protein